MNFKLFSALHEENKAAISAQNKVQKIISALMGESKEFETFDDALLLADAVKQSAADCDMVLIAVEKKMYPAQKDALISSMGYSARTDKRIFSAAVSSGADEYLAESMAFLPVNSTVMPSEDFVCNGFAVMEDRRCVVFIPLDTHRLDRIMKNGLFGFLKLVGQNKDLDFNELKPLLDAELDSIVFPEVDVQEAKNKQSGSNTLINKHQIFSLYTNMKDNGWHIAVADTALAGVFKNAIDNTAFIKHELISFEPCETQIVCDDDTVTANTASAANEARLSGGSEVGVAISDICVSPSDGKYIVVALANENTARVRKIFANDGEKKISLIKEAITQLFCLMIDYTSNHGVPPEGTEVVPIDETDKIPAPSTKKRGKALIWVLICILVVLVGCAIVALSSEKARAAVFAMISPANDSVGVTENSTFRPADDSIVDITIYDALLGDIAFVEAGDYEFFAEDVRGFEYDEPEFETTQTEAPSSEVTAAEESTAGEPAQAAKTTSTTKAVTTTEPTTTVTTTEKPTTTKPAATKSTTTKAATTKPAATKATTTATYTKWTNPRMTTTVKESDATVTTVKAPLSDVKFIIKTKGYGHGVGMSQDGAIAYAKSGWSYDKILTHYYNADGISIASDGLLSIPLTVTYDSRIIPLKEYLTRVALAEIGFPKGGVPDEAFKAQVVAIYTFAKDKSFSLKKDNHAYLSDEKYAKYVKSQAEEDHIYALVGSVLGKYVAYNGKAAFTPYFANSAGATAAYGTVWGGSSSRYPYLSGGRKSIENPTSAGVEISAEDFKKKVEAYNAAHPSTAITLGDDPADWIKIVEKDSTGYVTKIRVGNKEFSGSTFRSDIMQYSIKSHCFTLSCEVQNNSGA